ncbi:hypothetical protein H5400_37865 [Rhodococcus wratislaviensis]|nr:hypothetical protein [Rhodococcus sp. 3A]MBC2897786.1 hypothetical protein [Rhodococcus sp. 4CII]
MGQVHDAVLNAVLDDDALVADESFVTRLDTFLTSLTGIRVVGPVESTVEKEDTTSSASSVKAGLALPQPTLSMTVAAESGGSNRDRQVEVRRGQERISLNFADVARALRELAASLSARRIWLLLDEWSSLPLDVQPYLGAFLVRCVTPVQAFTVKIAAIEQQTRFRHVLEGGTTIGIELGADFAANINLDEFMVFEQDAQRARDFFRGLLFKHLTAGVDDDERVDGLNSESDLISLGFTGYRVFDELVRAAEGVPRDAINIAAKAAFRASDRTISMPDVRAAARQWFQADKEGALRGVPAAHELLNWVIDKVIREKRARGFLVNQRSAGAPLLTALFDARVLHLVRRGYSAQDAPGERYDVYVIDYGAYVDLINTQNAPQGMLPLNEEFTDGGWVEVPEQDLRALRRAILDIDTFVQSTSTPG